MKKQIELSVRHENTSTVVIEVDESVTVKDVVEALKKTYDIYDLGDIESEVISDDECDDAMATVYFAKLSEESMDEFYDFEEFDWDGPDSEFDEEIRVR